MNAGFYQIRHRLPGRLRVFMPSIGGVGYPASSIELWMSGLAGVDDVRVNLYARTVAVEFAPDTLAADAVLERLLAYRPVDDADDELPPSSTVALARSVLAIALLPFLPMPARYLLTLANVGAKLARGADTLINQGVKVEVLDALAVGLSAARGKLYTANLTDLLLNLGETLEERTQQQSDRMLRRLLMPTPTLAWVERGGDLRQVPGDQVGVDEIVVVGVGETIPVDGVVVGGVASVNQAAVTGEDLPVAREAPMRVVAGSVLTEGRLRIRATRVGDETTTARVARFIQDSIDQVSSTQRLADRLADRRVYITLGSAATAFALTRDLTRVESVFLVDYSCALKLGTPVAFKSGLYHAASQGVLIKGAEAMERLAAIDTLVFDKTGTLSHSEFEVTDIIGFDNVHAPDDESQLLALVASVEEHATHPLAQAVVEAARARALAHISHGEVDYLVAHGLSADLDHGHIVVGSRHYLQEHVGMDFAAQEATLSRLEDEGKTLLYIGNEHGPLGVIALQDRVREDAAATLARLRALGIERIVMISGDRREKAEALGAEVGVDQVHAEVEPEGKAALIEQLRAAGHRVGFVGDGVNDGPALAAAEVGVAMAQGADLARATAEIVLLDDRLGALADARAIAGGTMSLIRTNFNAAVGINTAILAGAMLGRLSPVASALLHNGTTLGVLFNALRGARFNEQVGGTAFTPQHSLPKPADQSLV